MSLQTDSNRYIVFFLLAMVLIVALALSFVAMGLKPYIDQNILVDKKTKILKSVVEVGSEKEAKSMFTAEFVLSEYDANIAEYVIDAEGNPIDGEEAFDINIKKESRKSLDERRLPLYIYEKGDDQFFIIPLTGQGLWDEINGYIALHGDFNTIKGTAFDHVGETPGLGAEIAKLWFNDQFRGKKLMDGQGAYRLEVLKGKGNKEVQSDVHKVDGMSGATITSTGTEDMLKDSYEPYASYFEQLKSGS